MDRIDGSGGAIGLRETRTHMIGHQDGDLGAGHIGALPLGCQLGQVLDCGSQEGNGIVSILFMRPTSSSLYLHNGLSTVQFAL